MNPSSVTWANLIRGVGYIAAMTAFLFAANMLLGTAPAAATFKKALVGGVIGGGVLAVYLPIRQRIKSAIARGGQEDAAANEE